MKNKLILTFSIIALAGCSANKLVYVPTPVKCPSPALIPEPVYPVDQLTDADKGNNQKVAMAYVQSYKLCRLHARTQDLQLKGYKHD